MIAWILLIVAVAIALYIVIGYPVLLAVHPPRRAPAIAKDLSHECRVTAVLAVYNGAAFLRGKLESLLVLDYPKSLLEIIVVSDGSTDDTESIAREYSSRGVTLVAVPRGGKAAALNIALSRASGEIMFFTDVRQPLDRMALRHLVANFADPTVGAVTGEMRLIRGEAGEQADMDLYWRYELWARKLHSRMDSIFTATGCIYAMRRELIDPLPADTLSDDAVLPLRAFFRGYRIIFDPEAIAFDFPAVAGTEFRRRLRNLAGLWQVHARFPSLFTRANRMRLHFLSHKFSRLVLPWAILVIFASTLALPGSAVKNALLSAEAALFGLALLDRFVPRWFPLKRLSSPARTFLVMNAAALLAIVVFFLPANRLWIPTKVKRTPS